jgi:hypothetical protein
MISQKSLLSPVPAGYLGYRGIEKMNTKGLLTVILLTLAIIAQLLAIRGQASLSHMLRIVSKALPFASIGGMPDKCTIL